MSYRPNRLNLRIVQALLFGLSLAFVTLGTACAQEAEAPAKTTEDADPIDQGKYLMKAGRYLEASRAFRKAVLADQNDSERFLLFANSLFAIGDYQYASHTIRFATQKAIKGAPFRPQVADMFSSKLAYMRKLDDLKRYITYNRRDPSALTVLAYTYFADNDDKMASRILVYLELLDSNDPFVKYLTQQIDARAVGKSKITPAKPKPAKADVKTDEKKVEPKAAPAPKTEAEDNSPDWEKLEEPEALPNRPVTSSAKRKPVLAD